MAATCFILSLQSPGPVNHAATTQGRDKFPSNLRTSPECSTTFRGFQSLGTPTPGGKQRWLWGCSRLSRCLRPSGRSPLARHETTGEDNKAASEEECSQDCVHIFIFPSTHPSILSSIHPSTHPPIHPSICPSNINHLPRFVLCC